MFEYLKGLGHKKLVTLNVFVNKTKLVTLQHVKRYNTDLSQKPSREDFIPFDDQGTRILNHKPLFKGWSVCKDTSDEKTKVAKMVSNSIEYRIYFGTVNGVVVVSHQNMCDNCTYNDLAIFFESGLVLE